MYTLPDDNTLKSIQESLNEKNYPRLQKAYEVLKDKNFTDEECISILDVLKEEAEKESSYNENVIPAFNRKLKYVISGKLDQKKLSEMIHANSKKADRQSAFSRIIKNYQLEDPQERMTPDELLPCYKTIRLAFLYDLLPSILDNGEKSVNRININDVYMPDLINGLMLDLEIADPELAVELGSYIDNNFIYETGNDDSAQTYYEFLSAYAGALNMTDQYVECNQVLGRMEHLPYLDKAVFYRDKLTVLLDRSDGLGAAHYTARTALHDEKFLADQDNYLTLLIMQYVFKMANDDEDEKQVEQLLDQYDDGGDEDENTIDTAHHVLTVLSSNVEDLLKKKTAKELNASYEWLQRQEFSKHDSVVLLSYYCHDELFDFMDHPSSRTLKSLNKEAAEIREIPYEELALTSTMSGLSFIKRLNILCNDGNVSREDLAKIIEKEEELFEWIEQTQDTIESDDYAVFEEEGGTALSQFIQNMILLLQKYHQDKECLSFSRRILSLFDFENDDSDMYSFLKEAAAQSMNRLHEYERCDQYLLYWEDDQPESLRPAIARLHILLDRNDIDEAENAADEIMDADPYDYQDTKELLNTVAAVYKRAHRKEKLAEIKRIQKLLAS